MPEINKIKDVDRLFTSAESRLILEELIEDEYFPDRMTGYRFAACYALKNCHLEEVIAHRFEKEQSDLFKVSQIDPDGVLGIAISELLPEQRNQKYKIFEKLAEFGLPLLQKHIRETGSIIFWEENIAP